INSKLANWYHLKTFYSIRIPQGSLKYPVDFLNTFPIPVSVDLNPLDQIVSYMLYLRIKEFSTLTDQLMSTYFEQIIDGMVYELYFPELLKKHNREIIKHLGELPELTDNMSDEQKMSIIRTVFNRLNEKEHPVRENLFYMNSIPEIAIIEGRQCP
ncbi:MAG: hypothetical protein NT144_00805, partial [Bacteroidia bacterium]|nr:hypothetical protein [Bacteroidia bacterium]